jgi:predicted phage-related endonuclease
MQITRHPITSREDWLHLRKRAVGASEVGALFGHNPYKSRMSLYYEKSGLLTPDTDESPAMRRGRLLESAVAEAVREVRPEWKIEKAVEWLCAEDIGMAATPDFIVHCPKRGRGVLQAKVVIPAVWESNWTPTMAPLWIALQVQQEMLLEGVSWGAIGVLVADMWKLPLGLYELDAHPGTQAKLAAAVERFWADVRVGNVPALDPERDAETVRALYPQDNGNAIDLSRDNRIGELLDRCETLKDSKNAAEQELKCIDTEIRAKIGDATTAYLPGWRIKCGTINVKAHAVAASTYRRLTVTRVREQENAA